MVYVGIYALIYLHTILGEGMVSRDGLPRGVLPSGILKIEKYCPGLKIRSPTSSVTGQKHTMECNLRLDPVAAASSSQPDDCSCHTQRGCSPEGKSSSERTDVLSLRIQELA